MSLPIAIDPTDDICAKLIQPFDPIPKHAYDLEPLIQTALLEKLPVDNALFNKIRIEVS